MFDTSNKLQKLVNGQYFSFAPDEVLPPQNIDGAGSQSRDYKLINGDVLIGEIKHLGETRNNIDEDFRNKFQLIEFFILSISRTANIKSKSESLDLKRNTFEPSYLLSFNPSVKNLVYDILAPFYNVLNLKATYNKFDSCFRHGEDEQSIYDFAKSQEWSLLNQLQESNDRGYNDNDIHGFLSDAVIRNAEVLRALIERIKSARFDRYSRNNKDCIKEFYMKIRNTGMSTYPKQKDERPYQIQFMFLDALCKVLSVCDQETFDTIYGRRQEIEDVYATMFTARDYAQSTILGHIRMGLPNVYRKLSRQDWSNLFHAGERYTREQIIAVIEDVKNR